MAAFIFPEAPVNGDTTTNTETQTTYIYQAPPGKWVVQAKNPLNSFVELAGDKMVGPLQIFPDAAAAEGALDIKTFSSAASDYALKLRDSSANVYLTVAGDSTVSFVGKEVKFSPALNFFTPPGVGGLIINGPNVDNPSVDSTVLDCYYNSDSSGTEVRYYGKVTEDNNITNKKYVDDTVAFAVANGKIVTISTTAPADPNDGDLWFDSSEDALSLFIYYKASIAWVPAAPPSSLSGRVTEGEQTQAEIIVNLLQAQDDILENATNHNTLANKVEALEGVSVRGEWVIDVNSSPRVGDFFLFKSDLSQATAWNQVTAIGFNNTDNKGITHTFSSVAIGDTIRLRYLDGSTSGATLKIDSSAQLGLYNVSLTSAVGSPTTDFAYNTEFLSSFDPVEYATIDYVDDQDDLKLNLIGGDLTGPLATNSTITTTQKIISNVGGASIVAFSIRNPNTSEILLDIWHPSATPNLVKYVARSGTAHQFNVRDSNDANEREVFKINRTSIDLLQTLQLHAPSRFYFLNTAKDTLFQIYKQSETEARLDVLPGNVFKVTSTMNGVLSSTMLVNAKGELEIKNLKDPSSAQDAATRSYVDSKTSPNATSSTKGIAKLGQLPQGSSVPSLDKGQMFFNTSNNTVIIKKS